MAAHLLLKLAAFVQRNRSGLLAVSCAGLFGANVLYHVFPEQTFRTVYQCWAKGQPAELSGQLQSLFREVLQDTGVRSAEKNFKAFAAFGFQPVGAGIPWLPGGALVGIPATFNNADDGQGIFVINGKEVDWHSQDGIFLKEALTLSAEAQMFSLAREVLYFQGNSPIIKAAVAPACLFGVTLSGVAVKQLLGLYSGPVVLRGLYNLAVLVAGLVGYFLAYDAVNQWLDYRSDRRTATLSKDYARGGVEYYEKLLARNRTLRRLMGKQGEKLYAPTGNLFPRYWFRLKHAPYTARRDLIVNILKMHQV
ncbi:transmembrane protein 177-like [Microcaecilia unicolor]|uniref:Transmembrane protein 177 n=1 Tax=Microcaecilia unicolor TaxID=1415580 RepID=A0A6P7YP28_9AMPH|nr:transmembrane protein 177-like [Microcaecilia unicolor]XP_030066500.1 transmembrane protein 177-like [Microcaecilia unicolor]XP_030066501.1 transmembrane protein 177-like [Microcaecilia unicolor]XP_030066502.1 transmembrane protein 177-like [Microcaecilia unicolor]